MAQKGDLLSVRQDIRVVDATTVRRTLQQFQI